MISEKLLLPAANKSFWVEMYLLFLFYYLKYHQNLYIKITRFNIKAVIKNDGNYLIRPPPGKGKVIYGPENQTRGA